MKHRIAEERMAELEAIMRDGNVPLKHWHERIQPTSTRLKFRQEVIALSPNRSSVRFAEIVIPCEDIEKIWAVRDIETEVIEGFDQMAHRFARKWIKNKQDTALDKDDFYSTAGLTLMNCVVCYTRTTRFSTYLYHSLVRRMSKVALRSQKLSALPNRATKVFKAYQTFLASKMDQSVTMQEVLEAVLSQFPEKSRDRIADILWAFHDPVVSNSTTDENEHYRGYSHQSKFYAGLNGDKTWRATGSHFGIGPTFAHEDAGEVSPKAIEAINDLRTELSALECVVLDQLLDSPKLGWMNRIAQTHVNPKTGKNYSRMSITLAARRVREKLEKRLGFLREAA